MTAKRPAVILAVVGFCAASALGQAATKTTLFTVGYEVARDNGPNSALIWPGESHSNNGAGTSLRIKASDHQYLADWDTASMQTDIDPGEQLTGWGSYTPNYYLTVTPIVGGDWPATGKTVHIATVWSENDWVEGNGVGFANYNWSDPEATYACTYAYAQDIDAAGMEIPWIFPGSNVGDYPPYPRVVGCTFLGSFLDHGDKRPGGDWQPWLGEVKTVRNSQSYFITQADEGDRVWVQLDQAIIDDMLQNAHNRGIVLFNLPPDDFNNSVLYSDDQNPGTWPYIEIEARIEVCGGDANLDQVVDGLDYISWSNNYDQPANWQGGDFNNDGIADGLDYIVWSNNYHKTCPGAPGAVPEPSSAVLLALCVLALRRRRHGA